MIEFPFLELKNVEMIKKTTLILWFTIILATGIYAAEKPNIVLVTIDTLRADHLSCYGYKYKTSPVIDSLAEKGTRFSNCTSNIPLTGPGHSSILTSQFAHQHGAIRNGVLINDQALSIAEVLKRNGYYTAAFLSGWTLKADVTALHKGFDIYEDKMKTNYALINTERPADKTIDKTLEFLNKFNHDKPLFLWVHLFDPHNPYRKHKKFKDLSENPEYNPEKGRVVKLNTKKQKRYDMEIAFVDHHLGRLFDKLKEKGLSENTLYTLTSDHGESFGEHSYEGHGREVYEAGLRVPLIFKGTMIPEDRVVNERVQIMDIAPTICDIASIESPEKFEGLSLMSVMSGKDSTNKVLSERKIYFETYKGTVGHLPDWLGSLIISDKAGSPIKLGVKLPDSHKVIVSPREDETEVYNLKTDRYENNDLFEKKKSRFSVYSEKLDSWFKATREETGKTDLDSEEKKKLKSLGYIN